MSDILSHHYFIIPAVGACVFVVVFLLSGRLILYLQEKNQGQNEVIFDFMDKMLLDFSKKKIAQILFLFRFGFGLIFFLLFWPNIFLGLFSGGLVTLIGWYLPKALVNYIWNKRCTQITNQMVDGMTIMANGIKSGLSITQSMERVVENMRGPLPQEFSLILNKVRLGLSVEDALNEFGERIQKQDVQMLVVSINILKETGGNLAETFEVMTLTIRDRQKIEKKIEAMTSQGVMQGIIITLVPFILLIVFLLVDPNYVIPLFTQPLGWVALFIMLCLQVIGGIFMKKIVTIKV